MSELLNDLLDDLDATAGERQDFRRRMAEARDATSQQRDPYFGASAEEVQSWRPYRLPDWLRAKRERQEKAAAQRLR